MDGYLVRLDIFEGPLDLLLYLIKENEIDIYDIPIAVVTQQYIEYLNLMEKLNLEVAGEFLVMAATLAHIKSKMLLPGGPDEDEPAEEGGDPREGLVLQLLEYKKYKETILQLREFEALRSQIYTRAAPEDGGHSELPLLELSLFDLIGALRDILKARDGLGEAKWISIDEVSVAEKRSFILESLSIKRTVDFNSLFTDKCNLSDIIVTFLALLELVKSKVVVVRQSYRFGPLTILMAVSSAEQ